jgi:hypothetical protein
MGLDWKQWRFGEVVYGVLVPVLVVMLIVAVSKLPSFFGGGFGVVTGVVMELEELTVIAGVPLVLGLVWNRWAGGASGFLLGSIYALYWSNSYHGILGSGTVLIAYVLSAMLIGYMAGALNKRSDNFGRLLISSVAASTIGGIMLFSIFQLSTANVVTGIDGFLLTVLTRTACGALVAVVAKVFMWYGMAPAKKSGA